MGNHIELYSLKYPIGEFKAPEEVTKNDIGTWTKIIESLPGKLRKVVQNMTPVQWSTPYRPGGWQVRQLVHHLCDSHLNAYIRFKLALTEDQPTIKVYDQARWAELPDNEQIPVEDSLDFLELLHKRWVILLKSMSPHDFDRQLNHPESGVHPLKIFVGLYAWHCEHHLAHVTSLIKREGW
ncbi:MAG: putative metal-dependent hydrolase [bacterium]|nr:MAG: putative metal-dependent hydrolase [bacterium]